MARDKHKHKQKAQGFGGGMSMGTMLASSLQKQRTSESHNSSLSSVEFENEHHEHHHHHRRIPSPPPSPDGKGSPSTAVLRKSLRVVDKVTEKTTQKLSKAQNATKEKLSKTKDVTAKKLSKATEISSKHVEAALTQSHRVYKESKWCIWARFIGKFPKYFPRVFSFTFGVLVPLWILILISAGFGVLLANYEATEERISNHEILASRARINRTFIHRMDLSQLPIECYSRYLNHTNRSIFEERINTYILAASNLEKLKANNSTGIPENNSRHKHISTANETERIRNLANIFNINFANSTNMISDLISSNSDISSSPLDTNYTLNDLIMETEGNIMLFLQGCVREQNEEIQTYLDVRDKHRDIGSEKMTFNWNRCWPQKIFEVWSEVNFAFFPDEEVIQASHPKQQAATVETAFVEGLAAAEKECLDLGGGEEECFELALEDASEAAGNMCHDNLEGTSWFFFTVMTTVGYGNQTPVTEEGRLLIYTAGMACLILFAGVLGSAGYIIMEIFDDFVSRFAISYFLQYPFVGVVVWGGIWIGWAYTIGSDADNWWAERMPDYDVDVSDSVWFAFISTSTIGLGDYYLQPEVMFASDALRFSAEYLIGFVFLSTFLNKIGEFIFSILPRREGNLEYRLRQTNLLFWKHWPCTDFPGLRAYIYPDASDSDEDSEETHREHQMRHQQARRVEIVKSLVPAHQMPRRSSIHANTKRPSFIETVKDMETLLNEEEELLKIMLDLVEQRRMLSRSLKRNNISGGSGSERPGRVEASREQSSPDSSGRITRHLSSIEESEKFKKDDFVDDDASLASTESSLIEL